MSVLMHNFCHDTCSAVCHDWDRDGRSKNRNLEPMPSRVFARLNPLMDLLRRSCFFTPRGRHHRPWLFFTLLSTQRGAPSKATANGRSMPRKPRKSTRYPARDTRQNRVHPARAEPEAMSSWQRRIRTSLCERRLPLDHGSPEDT